MSDEEEADYDNVDWESGDDDDAEQRNQEEQNGNDIVLQIAVNSEGKKSKSEKEQKKRAKTTRLSFNASYYEECLSRYKADLIRLVTRAKQVERWSRDCEVTCTILSILPPSLYQKCSRNIYVDDGTILWYRIDPLVALSSWFRKEFTTLADDCVTVEEVVIKYSVYSVYSMYGMYRMPLFRCNSIHSHVINCTGKGRM